MTPIARPLAITIDCADPARLADFWRQLVGGSVEPSPDSDDYLVIEEVPAVGFIGFQRVPESKRVKNRVHLDLLVDDLDAAVAAGLAIGAVTVGAVAEESMSFYQVMRDPEGNEFCFILQKSSTRS